MPAERDHIVDIKGVFVRVSCPTETQTDRPTQTDRDRQIESDRPRQTIDIVRVFLRVSYLTETDRLTDRDTLEPGITSC